jgi:hypothetical protein
MTRGANVWVDARSWQASFKYTKKGASGSPIHHASPAPERARLAGCGCYAAFVNTLSKDQTIASLCLISLGPRSSQPLVRALQPVAGSAAGEGAVLSQHSMMEMVTIDRRWSFQAGPL